MRNRFILTFLLHLFGLALLLFPNQYQGPIVTVIRGVKLRTLDAAAVIVIVAGSAFLYTSLLLALRSQMKRIPKLPANNGVEKNE